MNSFKSGLIGAALIAASAGSAGAQSANADLYTCIFTNTAGKFLPDKVLVAKKDADGSFEVSEGMLQYFQEIASMPAQLNRENSKVLNISWQYFIKDRRGKQASILVTLNLLKKTGKATLRARVKGYANNDNAQGKCGVRRGTV